MLIVENEKLLILFKILKFIYLFDSRKINWQHFQQQNCSNANDEEENNWQEHLELWRRKRISAILSTQTQENLDTDSKFENSNAKMNARRHSAADVLDHATHSNTPFSQPDRESTLRTGQVYISQNSLNFLVKEEVSLIITS